MKLLRGSKKIKSDINITIISEKSGYSKRHIQSIFKNHFGVSIGKYIKNRRLTYAALMIKFTKKRIIEIAIDLNYSSQQSFHRSFVNKFNCSPFKFREHNEIIVQGLTFPYNIVISSILISCKKHNAVKTNNINASENDYQTLQFFCSLDVSLKVTQYILDFICFNRIIEFHTEKIVRFLNMAKRDLYKITIYIKER